MARQVYVLERGDDGALSEGVNYQYGQDDIIWDHHLLNAEPGGVWPVRCQDGEIRKVPVVVENWGELKIYHAYPEDLRAPTNE